MPDGNTVMRDTDPNNAVSEIINTAEVTDCSFALYVKTLLVHSVQLQFLQGRRALLYLNIAFKIRTGNYMCLLNVERVNIN